MKIWPVYTGKKLLIDLTPEGCEPIFEEFQKQRMVKNMRKYTKGPWELAGTRLTGKDNEFICHTEGMDLSREEDKANANLIAASPELYDALKEMTERYARLERVYFELVKDDPKCENGTILRAIKLLNRVDGGDV